MATKKPRLDEEDEPNPSSSASHYHALDSLPQPQHRPDVHILAPPAGGDNHGDGDDEVAADEEDKTNSSSSASHYHASDSLPQPQHRAVVDIPAPPAEGDGHEDGDEEMATYEEDKAHSSASASHYHASDSLPQPQLRAVVHIPALPAEGDGHVDGADETAADEEDETKSSDSNYQDSLHQLQHHLVVHNLEPPAEGDDPGDGDDETAADEEDETKTKSSSSASHYHASDSLHQPQHRPVVHNLEPPAEGDDPGDGDDEMAADKEDIGNLLKLLTRDQLVSLLRSAAAIDHATAAEIRRVTDLEHANRNIFVRELAWGTTDQVLRAAFARYGEIDDCRVILDKDSGRSKGYGFVLFRDRSAALRALREPQKFIHNRLTSCHLASSGPSSAASGYGDLSQHQNPSPIFGSTVQQDKLLRKIYVGNVHSGVDGNRLRKFFSQFGVIEEGPIGFDRLTGKPKGYALFIYKTVEGANKALEEPHKNFEGHQLFCQKSTDGKGKKPVANAATTLQNASSNMGTYNAAVYGGASIPDIGLAQQAAMFGHSFLGMTAPQAFEQGIQPNAAALYGGASTPDMGLAQQAAMFGQGFLGMTAPQSFGRGMQPNAAAVYGGASTPDMWLAQQAAMFGHGLLGTSAPQAFGQGMRPNATALAMLAAQTQNPAASGITPVMLASLNPPFATALGTAGAQQAMSIPSVSQTIPMQNFAMGTVDFQGAREFQGSPKYQRSPGFRGPTGFQGSPVLQEPPGFPGPPGFRGTHSVAQQGAAANRGTYQMAGTAPTAVPNQHTGSTGGYGIH